MDFILRLIVLKHYYEKQKWFDALKRQLFSLWSNYQLLSAIAIITIIFTCFNFDGNRIYYVENVNLIAVIISLEIILFLNLISIYSRLIVFWTNSENIKIVKKLIISKNKAFFIFIFLTILLILLFAYILFVLEAAANPDINNMWDSLYLSFITMTTVGFGDIVVKTSAGRVFVIILACIGICVYAFIGSFFVNIFVDFQNIKKNIQQNAKDSKEKETSNKYMVSTIDNLILKNLHEIGLVDKEKYDHIINKRNKVEMNEKYEFKVEDFAFDYKNKKLYFMSLEMGTYLKDPYAIKNAEEASWLAVKEVPDMVHKTALYLLDLKLTIEVKNPKYNLSVIFSSKSIDQTIKRLIFFQKKPFKAAIGEINVQNVLHLEKEQAWHLFGDLTSMKKDWFDSKFARHKKICIILVKEIMTYEKPRLLESYGIAYDGKLESITYLK
ncbi:MAG: ion channel [Mycoplasma sp.]